MLSKDKNLNKQKDDNINLNMIKGNKIPLIVVMIMIVGIISSEITLPALLFIGIISGIICYSSEFSETLVVTLLSFIIGTIITFIISLIIMYYTMGGLYAIATIQYSLIYILVYIIVGCIGCGLGFYVREEIMGKN